MPRWMKFWLYPNSKKTLRSILAHFLILLRLARQFWGMCTGCYFGGICTSTIFGDSEFQWNLYMTNKRTKQKWTGLDYPLDTKRSLGYETYLVLLGLNPNFETFAKIIQGVGEAKASGHRLTSDKTSLGYSAIYVCISFERTQYWWTYH